MHRICNKVKVIYKTDRTTIIRNKATIKCTSNNNIILSIKINSNNNINIKIKIWHNNNNNNKEWIMEIKICLQISNKCNRIQVCTTLNSKTFKILLNIMHKISIICNKKIIMIFQQFLEPIIKSKCIKINNSCNKIFKDNNKEYMEFKTLNNNNRTPNKFKHKWKNKKKLIMLLTT